MDAALTLWHSAVMKCLETCVDALILGSGPAGLAAAIQTAGAGLKTVVIERSPSPAEKLRVSGGGKGNLTNLRLGPGNYAGREPDFTLPALERFPPERLLAWLERQGIPVEERKWGQVFCKAPAANVVAALYRQALDCGCRFHFSTAATGVSRSAAEQAFHVQTTAGEVSSRLLLLALGSPASPQTGATDAGARLARALGHSVLPFTPALVPLVMGTSWPLARLAGISLPAVVSCGGRAFFRPLLFTHDGVSGPAILSASLYWEPGQPIAINFLPSRPLAEEMEKAGKTRLGVLLRRLLPDRLADALLQDAANPRLAALADRRCAELARADRLAVIARVHEFTITPKGTGDMRRAEVARGGVATRELAAHTLESRLVRNLFFAGELLDITGELGGFNLHWAFASGDLAGEAMARRGS